MRNILFILICLPSWISAQVIDEAVFFSKAVLPVQEVYKAIDDPVNFSWIEEYELRTETHDFNFNRQEYTLRISPISGKEKRSIQAIYELINIKPNFELLELRCENLTDINRDWLTLFLLQRNLDVLYQMEKILQDKQLVYRRLLAGHSISFQKVIELETDLTDLSISIHDLEQSLDRIIDHYGLPADSLFFGNFLSIEQIKTIMNTPKQSEEIMEPRLAYEKEMIQKEIEYEQAKNKRWIDFAQLRYNGSPDDPLKERLHVGVGFRFPTSADRKLKLNELTVEKMMVDDESELRIQERNQETKILSAEVNFAIENLNHFVQSIQDERDQLQDLGERYARQAGYDPVLLLEIEERHLKNQLSILERKEDIFIDYIKWLLRTGRICSGDKLNFLSNT